MTRVGKSEKYSNQIISLVQLGIFTHYRALSGASAPACGALVLSMNPVPNDNILDWSKSKAFADNKINELKDIKLFWERLKISWEKEIMLVT